MGSLTIGEVASKAGLQPSALRYYEQVGLVPPPARVNGRRRYEADVLQRLAIIQLARQAGFTLAEIRTLFEGLEPGATPVSRWKELAEAKLPRSKTRSAVPRPCATSSARACAATASR